MTTSFKLNMFIYTIITIAIECEWSTRKINWTGNGMCKSAKKRTRMNKSIKQQDDFTLRSSDYVQNNTRKNLSQGATYIAITILVLFVLLYVFPVGLKFNISAFLQGEKQLGIMRLILGIVLLVVLCMSLGRIVDANTLDGETFFMGMKNALLSGQILRNLLSIMILTIGGIALIAWGITGIIS